MNTVRHSVTRVKSPQDYMENFFGTIHSFGLLLWNRFIKGAPIQHRVISNSLKPVYSRLAGVNEAVSFAFFTLQYTTQKKDGLYCRLTHNWIKRLMYVHFIYKKKTQFEFVNNREFKQKYGSHSVSDPE